MYYKWALILLSLMSAAMCMNPKAVSSETKDEHRNVLYFEADSNKQSSNQNAANGYSVVKLSGECTNTTKYYCAANLTCCNSPDFQIYGCCPILQGVCCDDGLHCCPPGSYCDLDAGQCYTGQNKDDSKIVTTDWIETDHDHLQEKLPPQITEQDVVCPGGNFSCPNGNTCCLQSSGSYACCPLSQAVCCAGHSNCCPKGFACDVSTGSCTRKHISINWLMKQPAKPSIFWIEKNSVVCPGGEEQCPDGTTCCKMQSGGYGCCPYPKAVCCSDEIHCCPESYTCDVSAGLCTQEVDHQRALTQVQTAPFKASVICKDQSECPSGSTCCQLASGKYGCCPLEQAVCCSDQIHCCPQGYQCDVSIGACTQGSDILAWLTKKPSKSGH